MTEIWIVALLVALPGVILTAVNTWRAGDDERRLDIMDEALNGLAERVNGLTRRMEDMSKHMAIIAEAHNQLVLRVQALEAEAAKAREGAEVETPAVDPLNEWIRQADEQERKLNLMDPQ